MQKYFNILPYLIIISSFGIYLGFGFRIEHLIIYPSIILFLTIAILSKKEMLKGYLGLFVMWLVVVLIGLINSLNQVGITAKVIADMESFVQPLALMILFIFLSINANKTDVGDKLIKSCQVFIVMLCLNSIFIIVSMFIDITQISHLFWGSSGDSAVAFRAMGNGRFSGVFNQPMEAGIAYSAGLFAWLYLSDKINTLKLRYILALLLMIIGGLVTVSKVFIFGGLLLFFVGVLFNKNIWKMVFHLVFWSLALGIPAYYFLVNTWSGMSYLLRFFGSNESFLRLITAGRIGEDTMLVNSFTDVWKRSPIFGDGFGVTKVYDSAFFQFFAVSGSIGLTVYIALLVIFLYLGLKFLIQNKFKSESKFFVFIVILIVGAGIGAPVLTINRASTVLWVFIGLLFQYFYFENKSRIEAHKKLLNKAS